MNFGSTLRGLRRSPRLSLAAVLCIAVGIAATATVATLVDLTTFRAPPFPQAERFVRIWNSESGTDERDALAYRDFTDLRERLTALDALEAAARARLVWHRQGDIGRRVEGEAVSEGYFDLLGVQPYIGRMISVDEHAQGAAVMLLSYDTWGREFNYEPEVLRDPLRVSYQIQGDSAVYTVIGVLPPDFGGTTEEDMPELEFWIPLDNYFTGDLLQDRSARGMLSLGRLAPGATLAQAQSQADALNAALNGAFAAFADGHIFKVEPFGANWRSPFRTASAAFGLGALLLLSIAVVNVSLLLLARTLERRHEFAIRGALGAGRRQLLGQVLTETLVLALLGGVIGVAAAAPLLELFLAIADVTVPGYLDPRPELLVLAVSFAALLAAAFAAAALPAWIGGRVDPADALREGGSKVAGSGSASRWGRRLVGVELALTLMLVTAAALLGRSYLQLGSTEMGFATENRLRMALFVNSADVPDEEALPAFYARLQAELLAEQGVREVALVWPTAPLIEPVVGRVQHPAMQTDEPEGLRISNYVVGDDFFDALAMPLLAGRGFDGREDQQESYSAVISASLAAQLGGPQRAIDQIVRLNGTEYRIVGIVRDAKFGGPMEGVMHRYEMYLSLRQLPRRIVSAIVHVDGDPASFAPALKRRMAAVAPSSAVDWVEPVHRFIAWLYRDSTFRLAVLAAFGTSALLLALVGLYAVLSEQVVRATGEIGIRKSLGATDGIIQRDIVWRGLRTVLAGLLAGAVASLAFARILGNRLYGVGVHDPVAFSASAAILLFTALVACWLPAHRAAKLDPAAALRRE
ncbi:MAG: ABC transporter permease [Woeseiaceae bacterium]